MHTPVLLRETLLTLSPKKGQIVIDCTLGLAGHSAEIVKRILPTGHLLATDFDAVSLELARATLAALPGTRGHMHLHQSNFAGLPALLAQTAMQIGLPADTKAHAVLADLGVSSPQIDNPDRGFSYRHPGPLDMRMDPTRGQPASALLNRLSEQELASAFFELGDETDAPKIARLIVERRGETAIETTQQLMAIICEARDFTLQRAAGAKLHPAARTFQALRILTNRELANLDRLLQILPDILRPGGVAAIITFHSGEDRRVKHAFKEGQRNGIYSEIARDPITATAEEIAKNKRARSAKLRWARRSA